MKIAAFYSDNPFAGWVQTEGFADVLKRMGHEVTSVVVPGRGAGYVKRTDADRINKPIDDCDLIIVSGPEWLRKWIQTFYPNWEKVKAPKVGWYHESFIREDFTLDYANYEGMFDFHFFPDPKDADKYKGEFLPLGVDCDIFHLSESARDIDVGFIGLMYPKRAKFVEELKPYLKGIDIQMRYASHSENGWFHPSIAVYDFDGLNVRRSMELLAETYRRIKVFVTFPAMSSVLVAKVLESMACGCNLVAPTQPVPLKNYFQYDGPKQCAERIKDALGCSHPFYDAAKYAFFEHRMELRFEQIFRKVGLCESASLVLADSSAIT